MARADISIPGLDFDIVKVNAFSLLNTHVYGKSDKIVRFVSFADETKLKALWSTYNGSLM